MNLKNVITNAGHTTYVDFSRRLRVTDGISIQEFRYETPYLTADYCPPSPAVMSRMGFRDHEISSAWTKFWNSVKSGRTFKFEKPSSRFFCSNSGYLAVYDTDCIFVMRTNQLPDDYATQLRTLGYVEDTVFVPYGRREAYYDLQLDRNCCSCGLASPF